MILIETVGTGQTDIDVAEVADVRIVVTAPGLGDDIQAMKAGLLEIADILVVNKGDREGAQHTVQQLQGALSLKADARAKVPVLKVTATTGEGIPALADAIDEVVAGSAGTRKRAGAAAPAISSPAPPRLVAERVRRGPGSCRCAGRRGAGRHAAAGRGSQEAGGRVAAIQFSQYV